MDKCVVRQAIKEVSTQNIIGYEILFQTNGDDLYSKTENSAADKMINFLMQNSGKIFSDKPTFMTFTPSLLFRNLPKMFGKETLVIQIEDNLIVHPLALPMIKKYKAEGYLFAINDFEVPGYVVCYGIHEGRFIIWEPGFGPMQYWENQMKTLWIRGITLTLFPTHEFMQKTDFQLKWWELYPWSRKWKRRLNRWYEYIWLNYPWFREMVTQLRRK